MYIEVEGRPEALYSRHLTGGAILQVHSSRVDQMDQIVKQLSRLVILWWHLLLFTSAQSVCARREQALLARKIT